MSTVASPEKPSEKRAEKLATRLRELRVAAQLTQQELAMRAGVSLSQIMQLEQGRTPDPRMSTLLLLAEALGVDMNRLTAGVVRAVRKKRRKKGEGPNPQRRQPGESSQEE
jgi:transcriptional regulator with XRE-family HTH domain